MAGRALFRDYDVTSPLWLYNIIYLHRFGRSTRKKLHLLTYVLFRAVKSVYATRAIIKYRYTLSASKLQFYCAYSLCVIVKIFCRPDRKCKNAKSFYKYLNYIIKYNNIMIVEKQHIGENTEIILSPVIGFE